MQAVQAQACLYFSTNAVDKSEGDSIGVDAIRPVNREDIHQIRHPHTLIEVRVRATVACTAKV